VDVDVLLTFRVKGIVREYVLGGGNHGWVDWKLLWIAQEQFDSTLLRVHAAGDPMPGQEAFLVTLTVEERDRTSAERGLEFHPLPEVPVEAWHWRWPTDRKHV